MIAYSEWWFSNAADFHLILKIRMSNTSKFNVAIDRRNQSFALELQQADYVVSPTMAKSPF